jgi:3D (Asp-Asp-Asp) domain-containing protein
MSKYLKIVILIALPLLLLSGTASALSETWYNVRVSIDGSSSDHRTTAATVGEFLAEHGVVLEPHDIISPSVGAGLTAAETTEIIIIRGFDITVDIDGERQSIGVAAGTTSGDILRRLEAQNNAVYALTGAYEALSPGQVLYINRISHKEQIAIMPIMYDTLLLYDDRLEYGKEQVERPGAAGEIRVVSALTVINGQITEVRQVSEDIIKQPLTEIIRRGIRKQRVETEIGLRSYTEVLEMVATAYTAGFECTGKRPGDRGYGITASGVPVGHGIVAVDPRVIPLGTRLFVEGYGEALAADVGGAIIGNKIDLFHEYRDDALRFGRRTVRVYILS